MDEYAGRPRDASGRIGPKPPFTLEFDMPEGLKLKGDRGTASVQWRMGNNGKVCITAMNGVRIGEGYKEPEEEMDDMETEEA